MKKSTWLILALFVVAVTAAGFMPTGGRDAEEPTPEEKLEKELLKRGVVLENYYTTTVSELEKALGINITDTGSSRVGFLILRSPIQNEELVFEPTLEAVLSVFPELEAVAMLRLDSDPKMLVYAPAGVRSYADMHKLPLDVAKLLDRDSRAQLIAKALEDNEINVQKVYILTSEEASSLNTTLSSGEVAIVALALPEDEFRERLFDAIDITFRVDGAIGAVLVGNLLAKKAETITFYYTARDEYEREKPKSMEELSTLAVPVE